MRMQTAERTIALGTGLMDELIASRSLRAAEERKRARANLRIAASAPLHTDHFTPAHFARINLRHPDICERILGMHAGGHGADDIQSRISAFTGEHIPMAFVAATLSDLTAEAQDWRHRTLEPTYPIIVFERLRMRCRDGAQGANRTCHIAIGYQAHGPKEVLGFWFETNDEHRFWFDVLGDLAERGVEDVIYLVGSSLALGSALEQVFPAAQLIPHVGDFVRQSQDLSTCKNRCTVAKALRPVHGARTMDEALLNLEQFEASDVARSNPSIGQIWRRHWDALSSFFEIAPEIRCVMTSTFAADGLRRALKMALARRKNSVSSEEAATLMYLVARDARRTWKRPQREWHAAKTQLAMQFSDRFC